MKTPSLFAETSSMKDLRRALENPQSRANADAIVRMYHQGAFSFEELFVAMESGEKPYSQRAAWPLGLLLESHPQLGLQHLHRMYALLERPLHPAVRRTVLWYYSKIDLPEDLQGPMIEKCFEWIPMQNQPTTTPICAMTIIYNIGKKYPELHTELYLLLSEIIPLAQGGILSRGRNIMKLIEKGGRKVKWEAW